MKFTTLLAIAAALIVCGRAAHGQARPLIGTKIFNDVGIDQKLGDRIPLGLEFTDEEGRKVTLGDYFGAKPVVLSLVYYKCQMLCPQVLTGMTETFRTLEMSVGGEFDVVNVSIDHRETAADSRDAKARYVKEYGREGAAEGWHFLTGDSLSISKLADAVGFLYLYDEKTGQYAHASAIMVATPEGKMSRYLFGIEYAAKDLTFSLMEASHENIGSPMDKLLLLCYHYDPSTGKYGLFVTNLLRGGGVLAILLLGGYMFINIRREKKMAALQAAGKGLR